MVSIADVAARAGVSIATVSRVLNDSGYPVRPETRQRVLDAVQELGFRPNALARGLLLGQTRSVGLLIPDITNPYYPQLSRGVEDVAAAHGYEVIFCNTDRDPAKTARYIDVLLRKRVDGIIGTGGVGSLDDTQVFESSGTHLVLVGRHDLPSPSIQVDNVQLARNATRCLAALGHRTSAFIGGPRDLTSAHDRLVGYKLGLQESGLDWDGRLFREGAYSEVSGYAAMQSLLAGDTRPTALFAANDRMAIGAMAAIIDAGLDIPDDVSVIGCDNITAASYVRPSLTTIALPIYEMGVAAMETMLKLFAGEDCPPVRVLPSTLVMRQSTAPPRQGSHQQGERSGGDPGAA